MSATLIALILQIIGGIAGGNAAGVAMEKVNLGPLLTAIAGALGGVAGGQIFTALLPDTAGVVTGHVGLAAIVGHRFFGGVGGAIITAIAVRSGTRWPRVDGAKASTESRQRPLQDRPRCAVLASARMY
jgi:hypothetical protein